MPFFLKCASIRLMNECDIINQIKRAAVKKVGMLLVGYDLLQTVYRFVLIF